MPLSRPDLMKVALGILLLLALGSLPQSVLAAQDAEGTGDHPLVQRISGSFIRAGYRDEFARISLPAGPLDRRERAHADLVTVEGEWIKLVYGFTDPDVSSLRVHRSFLQTLPAAGFEILFEGTDEDLIVGGLGFAAAFLSLASADRYQLTRRGPINNRAPVHYLLARHQTEPVHIAIATYQGAGSPAGTEYALTIVTEEEMQVIMDHQPLTASEMEAGLISEGRVAIQDILFGFDSDEILPESAASLATIAELMNDMPGLGLLVVGHTDDMGDFDYNLRLSMARASAVVEYLQHEHGIAVVRLRAAGAGMMAPIASNRDEAGRAQNRRVELVEIR